MCNDYNDSIKLIALDVDGTLFTSDGKISDSSVLAICAARKKGIQVVVASGRNYDGLPWSQLNELDIQYVITTNGSSVYRVKDRKCLYEDCLDVAEVKKACSYILDKKVYITIFVGGDSYSPAECIPFVDNMLIPEYLKILLRNRINRIFDLDNFFVDKINKIQKVTLNFQALPDGKYLNRCEVKKFLESNKEFNVVEGGFSNLEFTRAGISKGSGLKFLADYLGISLNETMAIGDSGNDADMIQIAGIGIAMGNAENQIKLIADDVTLSNDDNGIACAIQKYILS